MAATSTIEGVFCASRLKTWDAFTDQSGADVKAGASLVIYVLSTHDQDMCEIKVKADQVDAFRPMIEKLAFNTPVKAAVEVTRYGYRLANLDVAAAAK